MAPENQNEDIVKIGSEQGKLETLRADKEAPQDLKKALQTYRKVYFDEVNAGKNDLTNALSNNSIYQSKESRDYLTISIATGLATAMTDLATEGQRIKTAKEEKSEYPTLKSLKEGVKAKLGQEKTALAEYGELENAGKKLEELSKTNSTLTDKCTLANVSTTLKQKQALIKPLELIEKSLSSKTYTLAADLQTKQKDLANRINKQLASDIDDCKNVIGARDEYKEANTTLGMIETAIAKEKKPLTAKAYEMYSKELKTSLSEMNRIYSDYNVTYTTGATTGIFKEIGPNFAPKIVTPIEKRLTAIITNLEKDKPKDVETKLDPDLQAQLDYEDAQKKVADMAKELADLEKLEEETKKDPKTQLDRTDLDKFTVKIKDLQKKYDDFAKDHAIFKYAADPANPDAAGPKLKDKFTEKIGGPLRSKMDSILYRSWKREAEIKDYEKKVINEKLAEMLPKMDASWQANVNDKASFLGAAPSDENSPEFKKHIDGESTMFAYLVACESQVNFALSKKDQLNPDNLKRFEEYKKLCAEKLKLITENRANRKMAKAASDAQDQDHEYSVVVGTKTKIVYKRDPTDPKGRIAVEEKENIYETRKDTYKFSDCVEFVQPSDPKYKEINGGKGWRFKKDDLPQSVKDRFELQAANIVTAARTEAESEARTEKQKIITKNNLFDKAREDLGENAKDYFAALEALAKGDSAGAMALYKSYLEKAKNFSPEDKEKHAPYVADAQKQVEVYAESAEFYEGMSLMKDGKLDDAIGKFRTYIEKIQAKPAADQKKFSEQLEMSVEIVRKFNSAKMAMFDELKFDLKYAHAIKVAKGLASNADLVETLKKIEANSAAKDAGKTPPFKDEDIKMEGNARQLMLPYLPYNMLTEGEKKQRDLGRGGLQGEEITELEAGARKLRERIEKGEPVNFDEEIKKLQDKVKHYGDPYPGGVHFNDPETGERRLDTVVSHLFRLYGKINTTDAATREKGYVEIADYFKENEIGMKYTQKYLSKAMVYRYEEFEKEDGGETKKEVTKKMLADPAIAADVNRGAREYYKRWVAEQNAQLGKSEQISVDPPDPFILQSFQKQIFEQKMRYQYEREMRKKMTDKGWASDGSALQRFNTSLPYNDGSGRWYKPWSWSDYNEDDWVDFKKQATQFAVETIVTLPIGMGAGAIGRAVGRGMLSVLMRQGLKAEAIVLLEEGGIMALRANAAVWEGVSPALKTAIMAQRGRILAGYAVGVMAEGGAMLLMNSVWEGLQSGRQPEFFRMLDAGDWKHVSLKLVESIGKAGAFRAFGAGQQKILQGVGGAEAGALQKAGAVVLSEAFSGFAGTGLEALTLIAQGQGNQVTFDFWARGLIQNALQSYGTHKAHVLTEHPGAKPAPDKKLEAKFKKAETELMGDRTYERLLPEGKITVDGVVVDLTQKPFSEQPKHIQDQIIQKAKVTEVIPLPDGGFIINGQKFDPVTTPIDKLPAPIREVVLQKAKEFRAEKLADNLTTAGIQKPDDMVAVKDGQVYNKEGKAVRVEDPSLLPEPLKARYEELRRAEVKQKAKDLVELRAKISRKEELEKDPENNADELAKLKAELEAKAKEMKVAPEKLAELVDQQMRVFVALDALYSSERQLYSESKIIKKPVLKDDGTPLLGPDNQPVYQEINLFQHYESKTSAYSADLLHGLSHEALMQEGGCKIIKIGGDELVIYHAGANGKIQKLFIDISNMGPTNDTATTLNGSRVNLVDIFLYQISGKIKAESAAHLGQALDAVKFNKEIADVANQLFNLDRTPEGYRVPAPDAEAKFNKLKAEWGLDGDYAKYRTDMDSMRILAEYRADTRSLDASYKGKKDITFGQHINNEIQALTGMSVADLQKLIAANPQKFKELFDQRLPKSDKLKAQSVDQLMAEIAKLDPAKSNPEDLMMLYSMMARIDAGALAGDPALKPLADKLNTTRGEMIGEPAHPRVEAPRLMDAKVVSIDLPPDVAKALRELADTNPTQAHAILTAARTLAEKPLDQLKYKKTEGFAEFNILDHIEVVNGKIVIKKDAKEFREAYETNLKDKKVANIVAIETSLAKARATLEGLQAKLEKGEINQPTYEAEMRKVEAEISKLEDRMTIDPDTGAYSQAYLDVKPTRMFTFPDGQVPLQYRTWNAVVTELSHAGVINSKYGYLGMDTIMKAYHDVLKAEISAQLPPQLQHFKIIRSGGGKFEVVFLDARAVAHLQAKGMTPRMLVQNIALRSGQKAVDKILSADPEAVKKSQTDAAVRNSQFKYNKGTDQLEVGKLTVAKEQKPITPTELALVQHDLPKASARELIAEVMRRRSAEPQPLEQPVQPSQIVEKISSDEIPPNATGSENLFYSAFDSQIPKNLPENTIGWVDKDGRIHYNINHLNTKLAEGYSIAVTDKGEFRIKSPTGELMTLRGYEKAMKGTPNEGILLAEMKYIKTHESTHQVLEFGFTKVEGNTRVEDPVKSKAVLDLFATPDAEGKFPEGKIPLIDAEGKPIPFNWDNVQNFICYISDGTIRIEAASMQKLEEIIAKQIPGFTFNKVRSISTKLIVEHPSDAFTRYEEAASAGKDKPWWKDPQYQPKSKLPEWVRNTPKPAKPVEQPANTPESLAPWWKQPNVESKAKPPTVEAAKPVELPPGVPPEAAAYYQSTLGKVLQLSSGNQYPMSTTKENKYTVGKTEDQMAQIEKDVYEKVLPPYRNESPGLFSPEKSDYQGNIGHKLHLNVEAENVVAVSNYLKAQGYKHKYLSGGELGLGKIFTIYIGSHDKAMHWAKRLSEDLSPYLVRPRSGEVEYAPNVTGRFDVTAAGFARKDVSLGAFNPLNSVASLLTPWAKDRSKPETRKFVYDTSFIELAKRYGEYFYGSGKVGPGGTPVESGQPPVPNKVTNVPAAAVKPLEVPLNDEPNAISSGHQSKFVNELPTEIIAEGKAPQDVASYINKQGEIHYNSAYFEARFNVKLAQVNGKNVFIYEGKTLTPKQFFKTEVGRKVLEAMKVAKDHEVVHRQVEFIDNKSSGQLTKDLEKQISQDAELAKIYADAGYKTFDKRSIGEFLAEVADNTIKVPEAKRAQLEQTITKFLREQYLKDHPETKDYPPTFTFAKARQLDTRLLARYKQIDFAREFTDTKYSRIPIVFNLVDSSGNALINWRVAQYHQDGSITVVGPMGPNNQFPTHTFASSAELYNNIEQAALRHPKQAIPEVFELNFGPNQQYFSCTLNGIDGVGAVTILAYSRTTGKPEYLRFNSTADLLKSISYREIVEFQGITRGQQIKVPGQVYDGHYVHRVLENGDLVLGQFPPDSPQAAQNQRTVNVAEVKEKTRIAEEKQARIDKAALELGLGLDMYTNKIVEGPFKGYHIVDANNDKIILRIGTNMTEVHNISDLKIANQPKPPRNEIAREVSEVPRTVEVLAVGDLHGNHEILVSNLKTCGVINENANFTDINSIHWTGGARRLVFHGDILADRGTNSLDIMATIRKLQAEAKAAGGEITLIAGNHEDFALSFLTGKKIAGSDSDGFMTSMLANQGAGLVEFIQKYSTDPRLRAAKSLKDVVTIFGVETITLPNKSEIPRPGPAYDNMLAHLRKDILANMKKSTEGKELLQQMAGMKLGEYIDDTLFLHTDPTPEILALIEAYGPDVGTAMDKLNAEFQAGMRFHLLGEGTEPPNYEKIKDAFTNTGNRTGKDSYANMDFSKLKAKGVNRVIHGHSSDTSSMIHKRDGVEITSVDFDAGKKGHNMEDRSVGKIGIDGRLTTGTDVNSDIAATQGLMTKGRVDGKMPDQYYLPAYEGAREKVYLDKANDPVVKAMIDEIRKVRLMPENQKAQKLFEMVVAATNHPAALANAAKLSGFPKLGEVLQSQSAGPRHRSLLAKVLGEEAGLKVSIVRGSLNGYQHSWNEIRLDNGQTIVVDFSKITANNTPTYFPAGSLNKVYYRDLAGNPLYTQPGVTATGTI